MSQIYLKDLFDDCRFPGGWKLLSLLIYTPIGLLLVLLRFLICLQLWILASLVPDCDTLRTFLNWSLALTFGIVVRVKANSEKRDVRTRIIVANNVSALDHFVLCTVTNTVTPSLWNLPNSLSHALGLHKMDMTSKDTLVADIRRFLAESQSSVALQPEFGATNSRVALLKFNSWPFSIESSVQPVVIEARRPEVVDVRLTSIASTWWTDVLWFMFVPCTIFTVKFLKVRTNTEHEVLVREVEKEIADTLKIRTSMHTVSDKTEFEKRYVMEKVHNRNAQRGASTSSQIVASVEMQRMARQVSEVLPLVPPNVILRDLLKTRNVDVTITNILDGIVTYSPETAAAGAAAAATSASSSNKQMASTSQEKGVNSIGMSFQEKKARMIAEARERYIRKHRLRDC